VEKETNMTTRSTTSWAGGIRRLSGRHRWLTVALVGVLAGAVLVATGTMSFNAVLSWGIVAAMLLMHLGGHGMHGHGQHQDVGPERADEAAHTDHRGSGDGVRSDPAPGASHTSRDDADEGRRRAGGCH
jgi:hypothetical protein